MSAYVAPRRAKSAMSRSTIAETRIENEKMSDDLMTRINALQMKQFRFRVDRDYEIRQAKEEAQTVFDQAKMVQSKQESTIPTGWRIIEPPKNQNIKQKHLKERPPAAVFDPDDPRSYSNLDQDIRPRTGKKKRAQTPRRPRPKTAGATAISTETTVEPEPQDPDPEEAITATANANRPEPETNTEIKKEPLKCSSFIGFIRPMTAAPMRGGFGDPNAGDYNKSEKGKNTPHPQAVRPMTAGDPRRPRTAASRRSVSRSQSRADELGGQSFKDLKSRAHIDYALQAASDSRRADFIRQRQQQQATEAARLQERLKAFYNSLEDFKVKAVRMKHNQMF